MEDNRKRGTEEDRYSFPADYSIQRKDPTESLKSESNLSRLNHKRDTYKNQARHKRFQ